LSGKTAPLCTLLLLLLQAARSGGLSGAADVRLDWVAGACEELTQRRRSAAAAAADDAQAAAVSGRQAPVKHVVHCNNKKHYKSAKLIHGTSDQHVHMCVYLLQSDIW
jgi:hypothetical protein